MILRMRDNRNQIVIIYIFGVRYLWMAPGNAFWDGDFFLVGIVPSYVTYVSSGGIAPICSVIIGHSTEAFQRTSITGKADNLLRSI